MLQIQSRPELEAQQIYYRVRSHASTSDMGALIQEVTSAIPANGVQRDERSQQQQQQQQGRAFYDEQLHENHQPPQLHQRQLSQQSELHQQQQQPSHPTLQQQTQPNTASFYQGSYPNAGQATNQLPPLRSIVEVPLSSTDAANVQQLPPSLNFPPIPQLRGRKTSQTSGVSSASHSSLSSADPHDLSPRDSPSDWAQGANQ